MAHRARAALNREAERLVEDHHVRILVEDQRTQELGVPIDLGGATRPLGRLVELERRHPHARTRLQPVVRLGALAIDPQLALAHDALHAGKGKLRKARSQKAVDAHPGLVGVHGQRLHAACQRRRGRSPLFAARRAGRSLRGRRLGRVRLGQGGLGERRLGSARLVRRRFGASARRIRLRCGGFGHAIRARCALACRAVIPGRALGGVLAAVAGGALRGVFGGGARPRAGTRREPAGSAFCAGPAMWWTSLHVPLLSP